MTDFCRIIFLVSLLLDYFPCKSQHDTLLHFNFESVTTNLIVDKNSGNKFPVETIRRSIEIVPAAVGNGLRTDGYSTYINASIAKESKVELTATGWFALETYPTDTAGLLTFKNKTRTEWVSAGVNKFGFPVLIYSQNGKTEFLTGNTPIKKFTWFHVGFVCNKKFIQFYLNEEQILSINISLIGFDELIIGKDERKNSIGIFPLNFFNGIADEVTVFNKSFNQNDFSSLNLREVLLTQPDLNVPAIRFANDFNRPKYHLIPAANWTNESHGLISYKGRYHIFNQKDGNNLLLRNINWGHFSSPDLLQWTEHRPAIAPEKGYDQLGIWSGHSIMDKEGKPVIMYTGASSDTSFGMCLALPEDERLLTWKKYEKNPVVNGTPKQYSRFDFRDPYLWKEKDVYYMAVGFGIDENNTRRGALLLYKSEDLRQWKFLHTLFEGDPAVDSSGVFWEMPVFWKEKRKYILLVNKVPYKGEPANALYWIGDFVNEKFVPDNKIPQKLEVINQLLSPSVVKDENGLTTAIAIIPDLIKASAQYQQGWTHLYSIPRIWQLKNNKICQQPHPALKSLREEIVMFNNKTISPKLPLILSTGKHQLEIEIEIVPGNCSKFGFNIGKHPEDKEYSRIIYDYNDREFSVDKTKSTLNKDFYAEGKKGSYFLNKNEKVRINMFIDGSVVEIFINNQDAFTTRIFPVLKDSNIVELFAEGSDMQLLKATVWKLKSTGNKSDF